MNNLIKILFSLTITRMKTLQATIAIKDMCYCMALVKCEMMLDTPLNVSVKIFVNYLVKNLVLTLLKVNYKLF